MSAKNLLGIVVRGIRSDLSLCGKLEVFLSEQRKHLSMAETDLLEKVNLEIEELTLSLSKSSQIRAEAMSKFGLAPNKSGIESLTKKLPKNLAEEVSEQFLGLEKAIERCRAVNDRNGEVLAGQKSMIDTLLGRDAKPYGETD
jgi:flagella synthesis protein FlgN